MPISAVTQLEIVILNAHIRKEEISKIYDMWRHLENLEKVGQKKSNISKKRKKKFFFRRNQ